MITTIKHSGKDKSMETVKKSVSSKVEGGKGMNRQRIAE